MAASALIQSLERYFTSFVAVWLRPVRLEIKEKDPFHSRTDSAWKKLIDGSDLLQSHLNLPQIRAILSRISFESQRKAWLKWSHLRILNEPPPPNPQRGRFEC